MSTSFNRREKIEASLKLLSEDSTTFEKFESIFTLIRGADSRLDKALERTSKALSTLKNLQEGDYIELSAEALPEKTEKEKKRKKALLWFIKTWSELKSEVKRVKETLDSKQQGDTPKSKFEITSFAKGPFGLITLTAAVVVLGMVIYNSKFKSQPVGKIAEESQVLSSVSPSASPLRSDVSPSLSPKQTVKYIEYNGAQIALSEVYVGTGSDCDSPHYHALDHTNVRALDGKVIADPGGCGFGRIKDTKVLEK